jgi:hypothetical protein
MTLLEKCNADVYKAILDIKDKSPSIGDKMISILQDNESHFELTLGDMLWFSAHLPIDIWNYKIHTFYLLFESQQITTMT